MSSPDFAREAIASGAVVETTKDPPDTAPSLAEILPSPDTNLRRSQVARLLGVPLGVAVDGLNALYIEKPDLFTVDPQTGALLCTPPAIEQFMNTRAASLNQREASAEGVIGFENGDRRSRQKTENGERTIRKFNAFGEEMKQGETIDAKTFKNLLDLFGDENAFDILYQFRPEFKGRVPMPVVRSFLAEYLGDFIVTKGELDFDTLGEALPYLADKKLQEALAEVIKRDCLRTYNKAKRKDPDSGDFDVIADYIGEIQERIKLFDSEDLATVVKEVERYYLDVLTLMEAPVNIVPALTKGRDFPDLNQRINMYETINQKRILIGDEPGMGKSASAILTKEKVGAKCAVIITPSAVLEQCSWQDYLSSKVVDGKQIGYFKPGQEPRVLVVKNLKSLTSANAEDYDYVLISTEKTQYEKYTEALKQLGFDMMVVDEAHDFKNVRSGIRASRLIDLASTIGDDEILMMLTATPAPNKVVDIAMALLLLYPDKWTNEDGSAVKPADLVASILDGDILQIRNLLLPRMQLKRLEDLGQVPEALEQTIFYELSDYEREIYEVLLEEWELDSKDKLRYLRQILLNPEMIDGTPDVESSKATQVSAALEEIFKTKQKVVIFVNDYVTDIISGSKTIFSNLRIPEGVTVETIHGKTSQHERRAIRQRFQESDEPMLLVVSGHTVSVGVDLSAADEVIFYNEPWTKTQKLQEIGREQRPGRTGRLVVRTFVAKGTIEEGIHHYIELKDRAIKKLLYGLPLTDVEKSMVMSGETSNEAGLEVNPDLARYYISAIDRMERKIFGHIKEIGEDRLRTFLEAHGEEYAETYKLLTNRSYQANSSRLSGTIISRLEEERTAIDVGAQLQILDVGSGPEMLRRHIPEDLAPAVKSLDINPNHFKDALNEFAVGAMSNIPYPPNSVDYVNMSLAFHYTKWLPRNGKFERLQVLTELNRVLKVGGHAVISMPYSMDLSNEDGFRSVVEGLGFEVNLTYSGVVESGNSFSVRVMTLRKVDNCEPDMPSLLDRVGSAARDGLRFFKSKAKPRDTRLIATSYSFPSGQVLSANLNEHGRAVLAEEQETLGAMEELRSRTKTHKIRDIPAAEIIANGFVRIFDSNRYLLYKQLTSGDGAVVIRD